VIGPSSTLLSWRSVSHTWAEACAKGARWAFRTSLLTFRSQSIAFRRSASLAAAPWLFLACRTQAARSHAIGRQASARRRSTASACERNSSTAVDSAANVSAETSGGVQRSHAAPAALATISPPKSARSTIGFGGTSSPSARTAAVSSACASSAAVACDVKSAIEASVAVTHASSSTRPPHTGHGSSACERWCASAGGQQGGQAPRLVRLRPC
jgi:hypothetical protein